MLSRSVALYVSLTQQRHYCRWGAGAAVLHNPRSEPLMETMDARILPDGRTIVVVDREHPSGWHDSIGLDLPVYIARNASSAFEPAVPPTLEQSVAFDNVTGGHGPACGPQVATIADATGTIIALSTAQFDHPGCACTRGGAAVRAAPPVQKIMPDTDISGHDIAGGGCQPATPVNTTASACAASCARDPKCSAWTYVKPGTPIHPALPPGYSYCCHKACGPQSPHDGPGCPAVEHGRQCCVSGVLDPAAWAPAEPIPILCGYRHHILPAKTAKSDDDAQGRPRADSDVFDVRRFGARTLPTAASAAWRWAQACQRTTRARTKDGGI